MSLTADEIKEILELYGKGYSSQKITDAKGYSTATIRKYLKLAKAEALKPKAKGLEAEQIANQLDYPLPFVSCVLREDEAKNKIKTEVELEAKEEGELEEKTEKSDIKEEWSKFQKEQEIKQRKEKIRGEAIESIECLEQLESEYEGKGVLDDDYIRRQEAIRSELKDFILAKVDEFDSIDALSSLESIFKKIDQKSHALIEEYEKKMSEAIKVRQVREKKRSDKLLDGEINIPMIPDFVRDFIKSRFAVRTKEEATIIRHALFELVLFHDMLNKSDEESEKLWRAFIGIAKEDKWDYLIKLASKFDNRPPPA